MKSRLRRDTSVDVEDNDYPAETDDDGEEEDAQEHDDGDSDEEQAATRPDWTAYRRFAAPPAVWRPGLSTARLRFPLVAS
jgi:hypothetical protein